MASASVVGQHPGPHRVDSEPLLFKRTGGRRKITLPRKSSWEKMMFRRSSASGGECGSSTASEGRPVPSPPGPAGETVARGELEPAEGCRGAAPRTPHRGGGADCDGGNTAATGESPTGRRDSDCGNHRTPLNVTPTNEHKAAHRHRDAPHGRRDPRGAGGGREVLYSPVSACARSGTLPLERLTQGRTGVVKLARNEPPRREAWAIFPRGVDPRVRTERGEGHWFESKPCTRDWCDACSRQITAQALMCQYCSYTCHLECESKVQLDCNRKDGGREEREERPSPRRRCSSAAPRHKKEVKEEDEGGTRDLSEEEVRTRIEGYNAQVSENGMKLASDGSYTGFIKVHLRLSRPVTVPAVEAADSEGDCAHSAHSLPPSRPPLPTQGDCEQLHISTLSLQVALAEVHVLDIPVRKFALYRQTHRDGQDLFQKLPLCEHPLLLRLIAGPDPQHLSFVLKENETGEVEWHAFSVPELQNFLVILEKEEAERVRIVVQKYAAYRQKLQHALQQHDP
ncbi:ras association domain-containing protein 5 isoform 2-T2 [Spinachia spinachia]